jgi:hypothetical protein
MPEIGNNIAKADIDLIDDSFDVSHSGSYHLSIQIESGRFSYCIFNTETNKYIVLRSYPLTVTDPSSITGHSSLVSAYFPIFENDYLLSLSYKSSSLLLISPRYTLVPDHLFDPGKAEVYLNFNHGAVSDEQVLHRHFRPANVYCVFSCPDELLNLILMYQPYIRFFHQSAPLIESVLSGISQTSEEEVAIHYYHRWLDVVLVKNKKLLFYNSYRINAPADSLYYLLGVTNIFDVVLLSTKIMYAGNLVQMPPEIEILKGYVSSIENVPSNAFTYSHYITEPNRRNFSNLFNLYRCE